MATKPVIISSSGLKNILLNKYQEEDDFTFIFGEEKFQMTNIFAEFISPIVSHLHQTDPTIHTLDFRKTIKMKQDTFNKLTKSLITPETISHLQQISSGSSIEVNEEESIKLRLLSIFLGNDELFSKLNEIFPTNYSNENLNTYMKNIEYLYLFPQANEMISFIASRFYMLDIDEFLKASPKIQYMIISNKELRIESEDRLFDIISQVIEKKKDDRDEDEISDVLFYEQIEFACLSENKFSEFVSVFDFNDMSGQLWQSLCQCFFPHLPKKPQQKQRYDLRHHQKQQQQQQNEKKVRECTLESIIVGGYDECNGLGLTANNEDEDGEPIISPPVKLSFDYSSLLSYSSYCDHSVLVMNDGSLRGVGFNKDGRISATLQRSVIKKFTDFSINDRNGQKLEAVSAVCFAHGTLYMLSKSGDNMRQLVLCDNKINGGSPVFLDIGNHHPVSLFGGYTHLAAIGSEGEVIFINSSFVKNSPNSPIAGVFLPDGEKASSVACCNESVIVLSLNGRVFTSPVEKGSSELKFSAVSELSSQEIVCVSGTFEHFLAVSKEGRVFVRGSNRCGRLGIGNSNNSKSLPSFTKIKSLAKYEIRAAYAGDVHSLFETRDGKVLACGSNYSGQLLLRNIFDKDVRSPAETTITSGAVFCIAGSSISAALIGSSPPPKMPNMRTIEYE